MKSSGGKQNVEAVGLAKEVVRLQRSNLRRAALVLRLVCAGIPPGDLSSLRVSNLVDEKGEVTTKWIVRGFSLDQLIARYRGGTLGSHLREYIEAEGLDSGECLFGVNRRAIQKHLKEHSCVTMRHARKVGKMLQDGIENKPISDLSEFLSLAYHRGFTRAVLRGMSNECEDALQDFALAILEYRKGNSGVVSERAGELIKRNAIRKFRSKFLESRRNFAPETDVLPPESRCSLCDTQGANYGSRLSSKSLDFGDRISMREMVEDRLTSKEKSIVRERFGIELEDVAKDITNENETLEERQLVASALSKLRASVLESSLSEHAEIGFRGNKRPAWLAEDELLELLMDLRRIIRRTVDGRHADMYSIDWFSHCILDTNIQASQLERALARVLVVYDLKRESAEVAILKDVLQTAKELR